MNRTARILPVLFIILLTGSVLIQTPLAEANFTLELDASYEGGILSLDYIIGTPELAEWENYLILIYPTLQVIPLWSVPLSVIDPPICLPIAFPFPQIGWIVILTELVTAEGAKLVEVALVATSCWDDDGDGYEDETCGGDDCDDSDPDVNPGAIEGPAWDPTCSDGIDNDCNGDLDAADPSCELSGDMAYIPAGEFVMGSDEIDPDSYYDEYPEHVVYLSGYEIDLFAVTNIEFAEFLNAYGTNISPEGYEMLDSDAAYRHIFLDGSSWYAEGGYGDHPVIEVSWYGANTYCDYYGKRLPTEAEWEKTARGGCEVGGNPATCDDPADERAYPWGDAEPTCDHANYIDDEHGYPYTYCVGDTTSVGIYSRGMSPYGAYDMAGNVWEWVKDWYDYNYYDYTPYMDPQGPGSGTSRVLRGGSWCFGAYGLRVSYRSYLGPVFSVINIGFRFVR